MMRRPVIVTILAVFEFIGAGLWLLVALGGSIAVGVADSDRGLATVMVALCLAMGALQVVCGVGLWQLKPYGRRLQLAFAFIGLIGFPIGTVVSALILFYLFKPGVKLLFSGRPEHEFTPEESAQVAAVRATSGAVTVLVVVLCVFALIAVAAMAASIAVPGLLRARVSGNEASALASLRAVASAQAAFAASCGNGFYAPTLASLGTSPAGGQEPFVGEALSVVQAVNRQMTHYAEHVGQIVLLAKHYAGPEWRTLSLPKRKAPIRMSFRLAMC